MFKKMFTEVLIESSEVTEIERLDKSSSLTDSALKAIAEDIFPRKRGSWKLRVEGGNPVYFYPTKSDYPYIEVHFEKITNSVAYVSYAKRWNKKNSTFGTAVTSIGYSYPLKDSSSELEDLQDRFESLFDDDFNDHINIDGYGLTFQTKSPFMFISTSTSFSSIHKISGFVDIVKYNSRIVNGKVEVYINTSPAFYDNDETGQEEYPKSLVKSAVKYMSKYITDIMDDKNIKIVVK